MGVQFKRSQWRQGFEQGGGVKGQFTDFGDKLNS